MKRGMVAVIALLALAGCVTDDGYYGDSGYYDSSPYYGGGYYGGYYDRGPVYYPVVPRRHRDKHWSDGRHGRDPGDRHRPHRRDPRTHDVRPRAGHRWRGRP